MRFSLPIKFLLIDIFIKKIFHLQNNSNNERSRGVLAR